MRFIAVFLLSLLPVWSGAQELSLDDAPSAKPKDVFELPTIVAVQDRAYKINESIAFNIGYMPSDAFNKQYAFSGFYNYFFNDYLGWEVVNYSYLLNQETQAKQDLKASNFTITTVGNGGQLDYPTQMITTGVLYTPLYNKSLLFNRSIVYGETQFYFGGGMVSFKSTGQKVVFTPGLALRFFMSEGTALRVYYRNHFFKDDKSGLTSMIDFGLGIEFKFEIFGPRKKAGG